MAINKFFADERYLPSILSGYRLRPAQIEAAQMIEKAFSEYQDSVIEAPTGSGKTFAYLLPSFESGKKVTIATKTKQLMGQLIYKDVPTVRSLLGESKTVKILKGRKNYFCPQRFFRLVMPHAAYYADAINWFEDNYQAGITEAPWNKLDNDVCSLMTADRYQCSVSKCAYFAECPFYFERTAANAADILITNHHLMLSDIAMKARGAPGGVFEFRDHAVFDEAHAIADIYAQYAGAELSLFSLSMFFRENRMTIPLGLVEQVNEKYFAIVSKVRDNRVMFSDIKAETEELIGFGADIAESTGNEDIKEEYKRYTEALDEINSETEGLRFAEKQDHRLTVKFIPFESGESFSEGLRRSVVSAVFISATISTGGSFGYFMKETGLKSDNCLSAVLPAVFDFKKQARLYVPDKNEMQDKDALYLKLVNGMGGSCLIICNSTERMRRVGEILKGTVKGKKVLLQTDINVGQLDTTENTVLIGCASLREGVDLSGGGFRCVILDKLPFEYFKDFFLKSKAEKIERENRNPFVEFFLPRAVLYFKQAVGRLIRHESDTGLWAVFDDRLLTERYGKNFLNVLQNVDTVRTADAALKYLEEA